MHDERIAARFWAKVDKSPSGGCWLWLGARNNREYGQFRPTKPRLVYAHRFAWEMLRGPIPDGFVIDHLCRNTLCVNPAHLEPVTQATNSQRGAHGDLITHCPQGHPYDDENTYRTPRGHRLCIQCRRERQRRPDAVPRPARWKKQGAP